MTAGRWRVGLAATLVLAGVGLAFADPTLLAAAVVPLVYVGYGLLSGLSAEPDLRATRRFDPDHPVPGATVQVTLELENAGDSVLPDLRIADGVPNLAVVEGSPRGGAALAPGETTSLRYSVLTRRGEHAFDPPTVRVRSLAASETRSVESAVEAGERLRCRPPAEDPLVDAVRGQVRRQAPGGAGEGTEFYATREYRRGDPMRRIDWRHVAKTGEFVTVQYRDQQTPRTVVVVDVRPPMRVRPAANYPSGAGLALDAGERLLTGFDKVVAGTGVVGIDPENDLSTVGGFAWADGPDGPVLLERARATLEEGGAADITRNTATPHPDGGRPSGEQRATRGRGDPRSTRARGEEIDHLIEQVPPEGQVVLCTPALDDWPLGVARTLSDHGVGLVVVSPDPTRAGGVGSRVAGIERRTRLRRLADIGAVLDWTPGDPPREVV